ncbi:hypothetical protein AQUCO_05600045v1 [Aquilegia coerulea]|uniref:NAC domain-containing protein n=1 Tax=Aquilegia coerulea TaxID=218851 RepID=A0A2G5CGE5_AQUCA|nr:hypothetical protein AQUCO_05600045v1 [Aquilegia coerulea]
MKKRIPPGFRFCPSDQQLLKFYLRRKLTGEALPGVIPEKVFYGENAEKPSLLFDGRSEEYLYFFTEVSKKFSNSDSNKMERTNRDGTWKIQANDPVFDVPPNNKTVIGYNRHLKFVFKDQKEEKYYKGKDISFIMHEFTLKNPPLSQHHQPDQASEWTVCSIRKKLGSDKKKNIDHQPAAAAASYVSCSMPKQITGRKRSRASSNELMSSQSTTPPTTLSSKTSDMRSSLPVMMMPPHDQQEKRQKHYHPFAESSQQAYNYCYNNESQQTASISNQSADTYTPDMATSSMIPAEAVLNLPNEYSQSSQTDYASPSKGYYVADQQQGAEVMDDFSIDIEDFFKELDSDLPPVEDGIGVYPLTEQAGPELHGYDTCKWSDDASMMLNSSTT